VRCGRREMFESILRLVEDLEKIHFEMDPKAIRKWKKIHASKIFYSVVMTSVALDEYSKKCEEGIDFASFLEEFEDHPNPHLDFISTIIDSFFHGNLAPSIKSCPKEFELLFDESLVFITIESLLDYSYSPPLGTRGLMLHLWAAFIYYCLPLDEIDSYPVLDDQAPISESALDTALAKLSYAAGIHSHEAVKWAKHIPKAKRTQKKVSDKIQLRQKEVLKHANDLKRRKLKPNTMAGIIARKMNDEWSARTIRRDLQALNIC
jgi:hypothetical protein